MAQISSTKCNICEKELGKLFCYECQHFLCTSCKILHEKFPAAKRHYVTESHNIDRTTLSSHLLCKEHKLDFVHYCLTCELFTCSACVTSIHTGHSFTEVAEISAKARNQLSEHLAILTEKLKNLSALIDRTKLKEIDFIKKVSDTYISKVNEISDDFIGTVKSVTEINIIRASDYYVTEKQALECSVAKLEKTYNEYQTLCTKLEQLQLQKHHVAFFNIHKSLTKELKELDDIPNIEEPLSIEQFKENDYTDLVIEKIQTKYEIRSFKLQEKEIQHLKQEQEKLISIQWTKDAELLELRQEIERLKAEEKQNTESFKLKENEIQNQNDILVQENEKLIEIQLEKETALTAMCKETKRLRTEKKQNAESFKLKENEIQNQIDILVQENKKLIELQRENETALRAVSQRTERLKTEKKQNAESLKSKNEIIRKLKLKTSHLEQSFKLQEKEIQDLKQEQIKICSIKWITDSKLHELCLKMERLKTEEKQKAESFKLKEKEIQYRNDILGQENENLLELQRQKESALRGMCRVIEGLKTEKKQNTESLNSKEEIIRELELETSQLTESFKLQEKEFQQLKQKQEKLISTKDAELLKLLQEMERLSTEEKQNTSIPIESSCVLL